MANHSSNYNRGNSNGRDGKDDFSFEILEHIGVISEKSNGWTRELNIVSFGDKPGKYDIRDWDSHHERMSRGLTLQKEEVKTLLDLLNQKAEEGCFEE